ncbi:hypothetical protein HPB49_017344 [Dermacentor silvarum]|uniref:Uncharacterized protein n=1 Tax=Dermacentor silvarum TaxID=543639 RepID=A0ACB8CYS7_DERSI|nr:hypothetical protein HPB49_017344 [Dermacentor silvarum]
MVLWQPFRRMRFLRRCAMALALASCAMLINYQMKLMTSSSAWQPPWRQQQLKAAEWEVGERGREWSERRTRVVVAHETTGIYTTGHYPRTPTCRDSEQADHRHDDLSPSWSRNKLPWFFTNGTEWPRPSSKLSRLPNVWPDPQSPQDDRIVSQLMYLPPGYKGQAKSVSESCALNPSLIVHIV